MKFYVIPYAKSINLPNETIFPCVILMSDNWNDFGYATYFHFYYFETKESQPLELGGIKILDADYGSTRFTIPPNFDQLKPNYCSLGQTMRFYEEICKLGVDASKAIFEAINDVVFNEDIYNSFKNYEGFKSSLLRFSEANKALREAKAEYIDKKVAKKVLEFTFKYQIEGATDPHIINLDFKENILPYRINAFVGKNATGKTKMITELSSRLSGIKESQNFLIPERPSFSKVIAVSFNAFDELYKPFEHFNEERSRDSFVKEDDIELFSYAYSGLRTKEGIVSNTNLYERFLNAFNYLRNDSEKISLWENVMSNVLEEEHLNLIQQIKDDVAMEWINNNLSSGQKVLLMSMTEIISWIVPESIVFFDEPETHLHPNAIANFIRAFYFILEKYNSYAILATHSPLIIQEIPSKYIRVFNRSYNTPYIDPPFSEYFGESVSIITNDLFEVRDNESNYKVWLKKKVEFEGYNKEQIFKMFDEKLSFNTLTYINSLQKKGVK